MTTDSNLLIGMYESNFLNKQEFLTSQSWLILAKHYRNISQYSKSHDCIKQGQLLCSKEEDDIFDEEISIISYYLGNTEEGYLACEKVINSKSLPLESRITASNNIKFYVTTLPETINFDMKKSTQEHYIGKGVELLPKLAPIKLLNGELYLVGHNPIRFYSIVNLRLILTSSIVTNDIRDYTPISNLIYYDNGYLGLVFCDCYYKFFYLNIDLSQIFYGDSFKYNSIITSFLEDNEDIIIISDTNNKIDRTTILNMFKHKHTKSSLVRNSDIIH